jgi:hypothetical protein
MGTNLNQKSFKLVCISRLIKSSNKELKMNQKLAFVFAALVAIAQCAVIVKEVIIFYNQKPAMFISIIFS